MPPQPTLFSPYFLNKTIRQNNLSSPKNRNYSVDWSFLHFAIDLLQRTTPLGVQRE
jgi:hypothetical protein